ncbi:polysaccharide deacetylase family protein [Parendozoicomonas haliclonae]|uniref:Peptidoglycan deacetylase n=1 Tax=Parendozoicomonas haliclonae TaxID=1960125 RepID=A0A1X7AE76_9GAMM|nr:polysaccharide deacetylase family protein [Parendozoicomonas haliclonae]SMA32200.1 Peptidoglycan deacetylase [Parendozoicomonas haliclonae]
MPDYYPRNLQGYAGKPPAIVWPENNRLAVSIVVNYEEGSESCPLDGDDHSESWLTDMPGMQASPHRHMSCESLFSYGARIGAWRLLDIIKSFKVPASVFACGLALERNPALARAFHEAGWELVGHGWRWLDYSKITEQDELQHIHRTLEIIHSLTGQKATGWYSGRKSSYTRGLLASAGISWDSDAYDDELPYYVPIDGHHHLVIPYTLVCNDCRYAMSPGWSSPEDAWLTMKATFDQLYRESEHSPRIMTLALHTRFSGHPGRADAVYRFLKYACSHDRVWFCQRGAIASLWRSQITAPDSYALREAL